MIDTNNINTFWASLMIEELLRNQIDYFCISPGSRSTPLIVAIARHPQAQHIIYYDERGAAFHALGYARATGKPAVLIATSGTAGANYYPAIIEASVDAIPMLILTADRPPELQETGANQTIPQSPFYGEYIRWHFNMPCPDPSIPPTMVLTTIDQAVYRSQRMPSGPVHINCMFREPLAPIKQPFPEISVKIPERWKESRASYTHYQPVILSTPVQEVGSHLKQTQAGLCLVGRLKNNAERQAVIHLIESLQWPVFADITSGLSMAESPVIIHYFEHLLRSTEIRPKAVLHIGGPMTANESLLFLKDISPSVYISVQSHPFRHDPTHGVTWRIETDIVKFCHDLRPYIESGNLNYLENMQAISRKIQGCLSAELNSQRELSEPLVAQQISRMLPSDWGLFLASSMPIRDMGMYAVADRTLIEVAANRGASGIDGTIATASGFSNGLDRPVTLMIGDLAFLHDLNSLHLLHSLRHPVIIILLNNQGGGIFSFLPIVDCQDIFEPFFGTPHDLTFQKAAELFELPYVLIENSQHLIHAYTDAIQQGRSTLLEVRTERQQNMRDHQQLKRHIDNVL